ncbi:unnamed protein product [Ostreobium quekettii]|uniref:SAP domain-containing protein n=1 Tax=Ostreobium quekettii TaxID=121088 RepID=A0A8S1J1X5_9CHLO|nr:unnamed protein product [Ostreobium quekettii]
MDELWVNLDEKDRQLLDQPDSPQYYALEAGKDGTEDGEDLEGRRSRVALIQQLSMLNVAELKKELRDRGAAVGGRKMELVSRLATIVQEGQSEGQDRQLGLGRAAEPEAVLSRWSVDALQEFLRSRGATFSGSYSELLEKARSLLQMETRRSDATWEDVETLLQKQFEAHQPNKLTTEELRQRVQDYGLGLEASSRNRQDMLSALEAAIAQEAEEASNARLMADGQVGTLIMEWFQCEKDALKEGTMLAKIEDMQAAELIFELDSRGLSTRGSEAVLRKQLEVFLMEDLQISNKAILALAMNLSENVLALDHSKIQAELEIRGFSLLGNEAAQRDLLVCQLAEEIKLHLGPVWKMEDVKDLPETYEVPQLQQETVQSRAAEPKDPLITVGILFGGPGPGAQASLESAWTLMGHLQASFIGDEQPEKSDEQDEQAEEGSGSKAGIKVVPYFVDEDGKFHRLSTAELYACTLCGTGVSGHGLGQQLQSWEEFVSDVRKGVDVIFPVIPGEYGELGELRNMLKASGVSFIGTHSAHAHTAANKYRMNKRLQQAGFPVWPVYKLDKEDNQAEHRVGWWQGIQRWCQYLQRPPKESQFVVGPAVADSRECSTVEMGLSEAVKKARALLTEGQTDCAVIEPAMDWSNCRQFSVAVLDTKVGPIALPPTEHQSIDEDLLQPLTSQIRHCTPPKLDGSTVMSIRKGAAKAFKELGLRDYALFHGYILMHEEPEDPDKPVELPTPRPIPKEPFGLSPEDRFAPDEEAEIAGIAAEAREEQEAFRRSLVEEGDVEWEGKALFPMNEEIVEAYEKRWHEVLVEEAGTDKDGEPVFVGYGVNGAEAIDGGDDETDHSSGFLPTVDLDRVDPSFVCDQDGFTILFSSVSTTGGLEPCGQLFQQAARVGIPHSSLLRHLLNLWLTREGRPEIPTLEAEPFNLNPLLPHMYPVPDLDEVDEEGMTLREAYETLPYELKTRGVQQLLSQGGDFADEASVSGAAEPAEQPLQVWVLFGGDTTGRQVSLRSGVNAWLKLRQFPDVMVFPFLLVPDFALLRDPERLKALRAEQKRFLDMNVPEDQLPKELQSSYIRNPDLEDGELDFRGIWCLPYHAALQDTVEEMIATAEYTQKMETTSEHSRHPYMETGRGVQMQTQLELYSAGFEGVGGLWGGDPNDFGAPPRFMFLEDFASEAKQVGAVVHLSIHGGIGSDGTLQQYLDERDVMYTGPSSTACGLCSDRAEATSALLELEDDGVTVLPNEVVLTADLVNLIEDDAAVEEFLRKLLKGVGEPEALCIKPQPSEMGAGVAKLECAHDLKMFAKALRDRDYVFTGQRLSRGHPTVVLPDPLPSKFVVEPFISAEDSSPWIEVVFGLLGDLGQMRAFTPSMILHKDWVRLSLEHRFLKGHVPSVTPPPADLVRPEVVKAARLRMESVADRFGLKGVACISAFMHTETGEVIVEDVNPAPNLSAHSVLVQQALLEDDPVLPEELFRQVVQLAYTPSRYLAGDNPGMDGADWEDYTYESLRPEVAPGEWDIPQGGGWGLPDTADDEWAGDMSDDDRVTSTSGMNQRAGPSGSGQA